VAWYLEHQDWLERVRTGEYRRFLETQYGQAVVQEKEPACGGG